MNKLNGWILAARPKTLSAAFVPILASVGLVQASQLDTCNLWFKKLEIKPADKNCPSTCRTSEYDMATYMCINQCEALCEPKNSPATEDPNFYGLTDDEIKFCSRNKIECLKIYKLSWLAERTCIQIYSSSRVNDESDACRHYVWSSFLAREIGLKNTEIVLNAHENDPLEPKEEKEMDLANNQLALSDYKKNKTLLQSDKNIVEMFRKNLKNNKFIILKPRYKNSGGTP